jgi:hypothetical protein
MVDSPVTAEGHRDLARRIAMTLAMAGLPEREEQSSPHDPGTGKWLRCP